MPRSDRAPALALGVERVETLSYRGKNYEVPIFDTSDPVVLSAGTSTTDIELPDPANHTYTVSDVLPTAYYVQPFDFTGMDERLHDYFWEMNAQVADTNEAHRWQPRPAEITLMDCYCVHRGVENDGTARAFRTWMRLSFEERRRVFDRRGNAHNPLFDYDWPMVDRDIEQLSLLDGRPLPPGSPKTKPRLRSSADRDR